MKSGKTLVTGLGAICGAGTSLSEIMRALYAGERRPAPPQNIRVDLQNVYPIFEVHDPLEGLYRMRLEIEPTRTVQLALIAAEEALDQAGLDRDMLQHRRVGVCLGTTVGCTLNNERFYREFREGRAPDLGPVHRYLQNNPALFLADALGVSGPAATIANACSSGTDAIGLAKAWIEAGRCEIALAGGCDELSRIPYLGFIQLLITSPQPCRPFDKNRNGLNLGEGAGVVLLEEDAHVTRRGADPLGFVAGYGSSADAYHPTAPHPDGVGLSRAIRYALRDAQLEPGQVGFVNAHGTATPDNDRIEGKVLGGLFADAIPTVSTKGYTGHTLGAAGGLEAVFTLQGLLDQKLPATAGLQEHDPDVSVRPTRETTSVHADAAISTSLAFGGNNAALVFHR